MAINDLQTCNQTNLGGGGEKACQCCSFSDLEEESKGRGCPLPFEIFFALLSVLEAKPAILVISVDKILLPGGCSLDLFSVDRDPARSYSDSSCTSDFGKVI